jgi:hypothetical protein
MLLTINIIFTINKGDFKRLKEFSFTQLKDIQVRIQNKYVDTNREIIPTASDLSLIRTESDLLFRAQALLFKNIFMDCP